MIEKLICWRCLDIHQISERRMIRVNGYERNSCPKCKSAVFVKC